ncbi:hypothetical protein ACN47E_003315 [Coniothyrium glycines]
MQHVYEEVPPFLRLPVELRRLIYALILPHTTTFDKNGNGNWRMMNTTARCNRETGNDIVWRRGCTNILAVNRQVHEEAADMLFRYRWRTASNLTPNRTYQFLDHFSQRNLLRIKNYIVNVESVDDYTGMVKYNHQGRGLPVGIRRRVQELVDLIAIVPHLNSLQIHLIDGAISRVRFPSGRVHRVQDENNLVRSQALLDPFRVLRGVRRAEVTGVSEEYARNLELSVKAERVTEHV